MFRFAHPLYLYLLALVPLLTAAFFLLRQHRRTQLRRLGDDQLVRALMPDVSARRSWVKFALMMLALALVIVIMARPQYGVRKDEIKRSGIEVIIATDVSTSMLCRDISPSRLEKAKMLVSKLIDQLDNDKVGLVAFAGNAITILPITPDYVSAKMFLSQLDPQTVSVQGTNMAEAIERAAKGFSDKSNIGKALILITDAEDHESGALEQAQAAHKAGVRIFVLSVGTAEGKPIPLPGGDFKKDADGNVVITRLNERVGKELAQAGNGLYVHVDQTEEAQRLLQKEIDKMQKEDSVSNLYSDYDEQFYAVAILLILVLIAEACLADRRHMLAQYLRYFK